ncbi:MAG: hypothetical protein R3282_09430 [Rhodothermales bacterium]|nr:hypothetical protein [Rhodothermales bacterium]
MQDYSVPSQAPSRLLGKGHTLRSLLLALLLPATLVGCDSATDETVVLSGIRAGFDFEFDGSDLTVGQLQDLASTAALSIETQLANQGGFSLDEIETARLSSASIELVQPTFVGSGIDLRFLNEVVLQLRSGSTVREVASRVGFTDEEPADLNVIQGRDIAGILRAGSFSAVLQVEPGALQNTGYDLEVVLSFTVEVAGI